MSKVDELNVSSLVGKKLDIKFQNRQFILDDWGKVDNWCELTTDTYVFLEVESKQKHPNTNVLKVWPYLLKYSSKNIFLIQTYFLNSPGFKSNRGKLSEWLGIELKKQLNGRFNYQRIVIDNFNDWNTLKGKLEIFKTKAHTAIR